MTEKKEVFFTKKILIEGKEINCLYKGYTFQGKYYAEIEGYSIEIKNVISSKTMDEVIEFVEGRK